MNRLLTSSLRNVIYVFFTFSDIQVKKTVFCIYVSSFEDLKTR